MEAGDGAVEMMRTIERALDPKNIMDPGKIFTLCVLGHTGLLSF